MASSTNLRDVIKDQYNEAKLLKDEVHLFQFIIIILIGKTCRSVEEIWWCITINKSSIWWSIAWSKLHYSMRLLIIWLVISSL